MTICLLDFVLSLVCGIHGHLTSCVHLRQSARLQQGQKLVPVIEPWVLTASYGKKQNRIDNLSTEKNTYICQIAHSVFLMNYAARGSQIHLT